MTDYSADLHLALRLADEADVITRGRFLAMDLTVDSKPDLTPVSDADLAVETMIRAELGSERPDDALLGEEFGGTATFSGRQWVVDPIDGTKNFVRGVPVWATLIALLEDGVPAVGVVSAPALHRRWWAADGWADLGTRDRFVGLTDDVWRVRAYGDFFSYCLLAEGALDIAAEPEVSLWDLAALDVLVREAGGTFTSLDGRVGPHGGSAVATNGLLHQDVLGRLSPAA
ncbi:MAG: histidinol-phosphatase [Rhodococcus sp.]|nr:inositol monophosphatase family protein [Rhodococcus sp. (in: high G+C Gram-positive bacteria)]MCX6489691.1 histidinol-phosphatase [Rhodococcus sp. (in: high G+C Gram-positive bacteria)]